MSIKMLAINKIKFMNRLSRVSNINKNIISQYRNFSRTLPANNRKEYTDTEEWLHYTNNITTTKMGLTNEAIDELTDLVYIEFLHEKGDIIKENEDIVEIESVKATNSIAAPYDLVLVENNYNIEDNLENINKNPENEETSWIIKVDKIQ